MSTGHSRRVRAQIERKRANARHSRDAGKKHAPSTSRLTDPDRLAEEAKRPREEATGDR